jgi:transmembrane 9 superfamily protein 2/4
MIILYVFMGLWAGFYSSQIYKMFGGKKWQRNTIGTALLFPGLSFSVFFVINLFYMAEESSSAVDLTTFITLLLLWFGISVPLVFLGSSLGFKREVAPFPCKTAKIARPIP